MSPTDARYSLSELASLAGVTPRTIRYYISQGLLASPGVPGPGAKYDDGQLDRLRLIRRLQREHLPLAEIRQRLAGLDDETISGLADEVPPAPAPTDSALDYIRRVLEPGHRTAEPSSLYRSLGPPTPMPAPQGPPPAEWRNLPPVPFPSGPFPPAPPAPTPSPSSPARPLERAQWERISLSPDIELHVRRPLTRPLSKQVDRLVTIARELLEEDQP